MTDRVAGFLTRAEARPVDLRIRDLLAIWGYRARTPDSAGRIVRDLADAGLRCTPDLVAGDQDDMVRVGVPEATGESESAETGGEESPEAEEDQPLRLPHVFPLIGEIPSATAGITSVRPEDPLSYAQSLMVEERYSQLAVMTGPYELVGAVSWRSIATARLSGPVTELAQAIDDDPKTVRTRDNLLDQIDTIYKADFVFVRAPDDQICGIVTTADLSARFRDLTSPFFCLGEIEHRLRRAIKQKGITVEEIRQATHDNRIHSIEKMTLGNYCYLLKDEDIWRKTGWGVYQERFLEYLGYAREIRNRVAHYDANPVSPQELEHLSKCLANVRSVAPGPLG